MTRQATGNTAGENPRYNVGPRRRRGWTTQGRGSLHCVPVAKNLALQYAMPNESSDPPRRRRNLLVRQREARATWKHSIGTFARIARRAASAFELNRKSRSEPRACLRIVRRGITLHRDASVAAVGPLVEGPTRPRGEHCRREWRQRITCGTHVFEAGGAATIEASPSFFEYITRSRAFSLPSPRGPRAPAGLLAQGRQAGLSNQGHAIG